MPRDRTLKVQLGSSYRVLCLLRPQPEKMAGNQKIMTPVLAKATSHEFLRHHLIEINESLPLIEAIDELHPQDGRSVAIRIIVLNHVIGLGFGADPKRLQASLSSFGLRDHASLKDARIA